MKRTLPRPPRSAARAPRKPAAWRRSPSTDRDLKSTRLNSSHLVISYAVFCFKQNADFDEACPGIEQGLNSLAGGEFSGTLLVFYVLCRAAIAEFVVERRKLAHYVMHTVDSAQ